MIAVTGRPNVGKSSLVNLLAKRDVAITSAIPGTTRDVIEVALDLEGIPVTLLDTAGLRVTMDPVEAEGVRRAQARAREADLIILVEDDPDQLPEATDGRMVVLNKCDLGISGSHPIHGISCTTGAGIEDFLRSLCQECRGLVPKGGDIVLSRERHRECAKDALTHLERALISGNDIPLDLFAEHLRCSVRSLGRLTGRVHPEEVLDAIFSNFCIGK
ncbi:MAG: GTPase [Geminicoccaceae bacterium]